MSDLMLQLFANMATESTLELVGDLQRMKRFVEFATTHTIREVREWLTQQVDGIQPTDEDEESSNETD